jgi:branched-chain amino acid transport system permease protein
MTTLCGRGRTAALLGGLTSLSGAFVGGLAVGVIEASVGRAFVQSTFPGVQTVAMLCVILLVLLVRPRGLLGRAQA